jgi:DNA-binding transcriptional LysR family regulator
MNADKERNAGQETRIDALSRIDSRQLRILLAVVREQSFTAAAEKLHMTQPALSRSVQLLEERLGIRLIERTSKSFGLTQFGRIVVDRAHIVEREFEQLLNEIRALQDGEAGSVSIGVGPSAIGYLAPAIRLFQEERPRMKVRIAVDSMEANYQALLDGELDVISTALNFPDHNRLVTEELAVLRNVVIAGETHPLAGRARVTASELAGYPWIFFSNDQMGYERVASYFAANNVEPPQPSIETNALDTVFTLLNEGSYLASVPSIVLEHAKKLGLAEIDVDGAFWSIAIGIAYLRSIHPPPAITSLSLILRRHFETE